MKFKAEITIMPLRSHTDPNGEHAEKALHKMGYSSIEEVRIGKNITLMLEANSKEDAMHILNKACNDLLVNPVAEGFEYTIQPID